ncbi:nucleotidyltransferase domain-containing protein [Nocardia sp. alder85J]|uniref:nucleotidyltransferase domain-containing protein n=1 Tax=Nocardia sp. alder85J TaxID=2862949 RepID=UPI001CD473DC|nr:nucleotidyltransferase domain-containing protein [Nocardia sp. alder85J]MCX4097584.1 nucleotidyltransferase domain-containing protein [Nocardia sp. alder85J]
MELDVRKIAYRLVSHRFPEARAAWLGGSAAAGTGTVTSDLDITVLLAGTPAPYRESLSYGGWPVELFVQTEESIRWFCADERRRGKPTTLRLIGDTTILVDRDGSGARLQAACVAAIGAGPDPVSAEELDEMRYRVTDLLDDLIGGAPEHEDLLIAAELWRGTAELLLAGNGHWRGGGKWLHREAVAHDLAAGTDYAETLARATRSVAQGSAEPMVAVVSEVLELFGGPLFDGYRIEGPEPVRRSASSASAE